MRRSFFPPIWVSPGAFTGSPKPPDNCKKAVAQSLLFPRHVPQQTADASMERLSFVPNLNTREPARPVHPSRVSRLHTQAHPHRLSAAMQEPAQLFPVVVFRPDG